MTDSTTTKDTVIHLFGVMPEIPDNDQVRSGSFSWFIRTTLTDQDGFGGEPWNQGVFAGMVAWAEALGTFSERRDEAIKAGIARALEFVPVKDRDRLEKVAWAAYRSALAEQSRLRKAQEARKNAEAATGDNPATQK